MGSMGLDSLAGCNSMGAASRAGSGTRAALSDSRAFRAPWLTPWAARKVPGGIPPFGRLGIRRRLAGPATPSPASFAFRLPRAAAGLLLVLAGLLALSAPARAAVLVSNVDQGEMGASNLAINSFDLAQAFKTGPAIAGYTLESIGISLTSISPDDQLASEISVKLHESSPTGTLVATLTSTDDITANTTGTYTFTAPANTTLAASTTYHLVFETSVPNVDARRTNSNAEDSGGATGWSIADNSGWRSTFSTGAFTDATEALMIQVNGTGPTNTDATGAPTISGTPRTGQTLTADTSNIADANGLTNATFEYQWVRVDSSNTETDVGTDSTYELVDGDVGNTIKVEVSFTDDAGFPEGPLTSDATGTVAGMPGITVSETFLNVIEEDTDGDSYTVVLDVEPTHTVTVTVVDDSGGLTVRPASLVFTTTDYNEPRTVTVTAGDDADFQNFSATLTHSAESDDTGYQGITIDEVNVSVFDNDTPQVTGVTVTPVGAALLVEWTAVNSASGYHVQWKSGSQNYDSINRQATITVSGSVTSHTIPGLTNGTEYTVRVQATRNRANDGPWSDEVTGRPTGPGVTLSKTALEVDEEDTAGSSYTLVLGALPEATVTVMVAGHAGTDVRLSPDRLTFTTGNWDRPQPVTVTAVDDADTDDDTVNLTHSAESTDGDYNNIAIAGVTVTVKDNDAPPVEEGWWGARRLVIGNDANGHGIPSTDGTGRLEVFYQGKWGTVCSDRFDSDFTVFGRDANDNITRKEGVSNKAAHVACRSLGHNTGSTVARPATMSVAPDSVPIHLDDVRCADEEADWRLNRNKDPNDPDWQTSRARLDQCYHAGIGLHNCYIGAREETIRNPAPVDPETGEPYPDHEYDVHLECTGTAPQMLTQVVATQLTASFEDAPATHDGVTPFTVAIRFNVTPHGAEGEMTDAALQDVIGVTNATVTSVARVDGDGAHRLVTVAPAGSQNVSLSLLPRPDCTALCTASGGGLATAVIVQVRAGPPAFSAVFENAPEAHDGASVFRVEILFSEPPDVWNKRLRAILQASITGGTVEAVNRVDREVPERRYADIAPAGDGPVTLELGPGPDCDDQFGVCSQDGELLAAAIALEIPGPAVEEDTGVVTPPEEATEEATEETAGPPPVLAPFTARFDNAPAVHAGSGRFTVDLVFSETPQGPGGTPPVITNRALQGALEVTGGEIAKVARIARSPTERRVTVEPDDEGTVTLRLGPRADCAAAGAVCTGDGRMLSAAVAVTIEGPPGLSVADARAEEGAGVDMAFTVTLDRPVTVTVTVDYRTEDVAGLGEAGADYEAASGTLEFAAGDTSKTIAVRLLDDDHDEGSESFLLWLENPVNAYLDDFVAVGTIGNTDLMPEAWLGRFGRTVAEQVLDAVESRLRADPRAGLAVTLAGRRLGGGALDGEALEAAEEKARLADLSAWLQGESCREGSGAGADCPAGTLAQSRALTGRDLLTGSSFALSGGSAGGGFATVWGRGAVSRFDGREGELNLDGEVASVLLGTDWARERWSAGLVVSHARGEGGYRGEGGGAVDSTLTGLYPWGRYAMTDRVTLWGAAGYGSGTLTLTPEGQAPLETDMDLALAAAGVRGVVVAAPPDGGPELAVKTDALAVRTSSDAVTGGAGGSLAAATADVTRVRLGLEGTWRGLALGTGTLAPRLEVGVRHDGGDAETGFGLDIGAGLAWSDPDSGIQAEASGRGLLTHESSGLGQRGFAGRLGWDPRPGTERGPSLTLTQTMGLSASGGADALLGRRTLAGLAPHDDGEEFANRRFEMTLGYGFAVFGDEFTVTPGLGLGWSERVRETVLGLRLAEERIAGLVFGLDVEGARREPSAGAGAPVHRLGFGLGWRLVGTPGAAFDVRVEGARLEAANDRDDAESRLGLRLTARW